MLYFVVSEQLHWIEGEGYVVVKAAAADGEEDPATGSGDRGDRAAPPRMWRRREPAGSGAAS